MAKIVIDARIINSSTGRYVERLLTYLQDVDTENHYIVLVPKKDLEYWKAKNDNFTVREANYSAYSFGEQLGFAWLLYRLKADLVHFCMPQQPILYRGAHVTTVHDTTLLKTYNSDKNWLYYHFKQFIGGLVFWWIARSSKHILVPSLYTRRDFLDYVKIDQSKVSVTYEAADTNKYVPQKVELPYEKFVMYVGQQSDYKNIRRLIQAHQLLLKKRPELGLVLVGAKSKSLVGNQQWAKKNNYQNVYFSGFVSNEGLSWLYQHCEAYIFPSLMEGFGLPGLEAMTEGAPVVSSEATCLPEIYGNAAVYFNPFNVDDMAEKIEQVLDDESLRKKLVAAGRQRLQRYSWIKTASQTHAIYMKALEQRK